jgi:hypothetical protein
MQRGASESEYQRKIDWSVMQIKINKIEIDEQIREASDSIDDGSNFPGMTYEEGVIAALDWVLGNREESPMSENLIESKSDATCWTCDEFVYSGEQDIGYCYIHDRSVKQTSLCVHHPDYVEGDEIDIFDEDSD